MQKVTGGVGLRVRLNLFRQFLLFYFIYVLLGGVFLFALPHRPKETEYAFSKELPRVKDRVVLIEENDQSIKVRLGLIANAENSIDLAYHSLHSDPISEVIFASLLEAADRGVQVRIIMDGIFHRLYGSMRDLRYVLESHPNVEFRLYEPFNWWKPWTWNNRLHDKIMVVDNKIGLISGRNIGSRYYLTEEWTDKFVLDLDVVVLAAGDEQSGSAVHQLGDYFSLLWDHPYTQAMKTKMTETRKAQAHEERTNLTETLTQSKALYPNYFVSVLPWLEEQGIKINSIRLIHNPITRGKKEPWVWMNLVELARNARESIVVQSPYVIPTRGMLRYLEVEALAGKEVLLYTNSLAASPNIMAVAGYKGKRGFLGSWVTEIWEYYGPGSLHGKALLFDNNLSVVGSFNIDARSSFLSTETMLVIESEEFNTHLRQVVQGRTQLSQPIIASNGAPQAPWYKRGLVGIVRFLTPFFDFLL